MDGAQELEWLEAQKIVISKDLIAAAKRQLEFLAAVDRRRSLYDGPILEKAIHRYKTCWLPLLAKHSELGVLEDPLVVPFDCEWIWHCHRLNPVQYKKDCEEFYGRILDNQNVKSSLQGMPKRQTAETWAKLYPEEPYDLDYNTALSDTHADLHARSETGITYDLVSAVKRQSSFYYQVSRPSMCDEIFLEGALARYRGFLQLIKRNLERSIKCFCVPTYDIDLIWHSHQLQPLSYCKDMLELLGKVLEHDDTDSDRTKGKKLDVGYSETTRQWEDTYGSRYWRAGAMYRGSVPSPLKVTPHRSSYDANKVLISGKSQKLLPLPQTMVVEVLLEIVGIRNLPTEKNGNVFVSFSKKQPDMLFSGSCTLTIFSESGKKRVAGFECEPTGELVLALMTSSTSHMPLSKPAKTIGITSLPLADLLDPNSKLSVDKWFELKPQSGNVGSKPVYLHVAASCTVPVPAPLVFHIVKSHPLSMNTCFFPLPGKVQQTKGWAHFIDDNGNGIISLQMRNLKETDRKNNCVSKRKVFGVTSLSRKPQLLAECEENTWLLKNSNFSFYIEKKTNQEGHLIEVRGDRQIKLVQGKKLEFEPKSSSHIELGFITVVEFSTNNPYGKAMALFDMKSSLIMVNEEWFVFPGIILVFILSKVLKKDGYSVLEDDANNAKEMKNSKVETYNSDSTPLDPSNVSSMEAAPAEMKTTVKSGGCGSGCGGCGGGCGNAITTGEPGGCGSGCGGGCGGGCGSMVRSSGCGGCGAGGCGGGCGNMVAADKSGGCGSGCGSCGAETNGNVANMGHGGELPIPA